MNVLIEQLGKRDAIKEHKQIFSFLHLLFKTMSKRSKTKYLLDIYEKYYVELIENECFEFVSFLDQHLTKRQINNRMKWRLKQNIDRLEWEHEIEEFYLKMQARKKLLTINLN